MNNFHGTDKKLEMISTSFQNMFPPININKVQLRAIRRVLLVNYKAEDDTIDIRHYTITVKLSCSHLTLAKIQRTWIPYALLNL